MLREHTLYALNALDEIPELPGPKFVFAHLLMPHPPYVIDADGSPMGRAQVDAQGDTESYRAPPALRERADARPRRPDHR